MVVDIIINASQKSCEFVTCVCVTKSDRQESGKETQKILATLVWGVGCGVFSKSVRLV